MLWCLTYNCNLSNQIESTDCVLKINTFTKNISILVIDWLVSPNLLRVLFLGSILDQCYAFSAIPEPETKNRLPEGNTKINGILILYPHNKICRASMILCPKYSTFCWWQEFYIIILAEKHEVLNLALFYISTHTWNRYIKNLTVVNILVLKWNWYTFLFMFFFLFIRQFWFFILGRQTSSLPPPTATRLLHFWGNAVMNWLYSWIEQTFPYNSDNSMKDITLPLQFTISFKNKIQFSNIFPINTGILSTSTFEFSHNICCNICSIFSGGWHWNCSQLRNACLKKTDTLKKV